MINSKNLTTLLEVIIELLEKDYAMIALFNSSSAMASVLVGQWDMFVDVVRKIWRCQRMHIQKHAPVLLQEASTHYSMLN